MSVATNTTKLDPDAAEKAAVAQLALRGQRAAQRTRLVRLIRALVLAVFLLFWQFGSLIERGSGRALVDPFIWSAPSRIVVRIRDWANDGIILENLLVTLYEAVGAFTIGVSGGVVVGFLLARSDFWSRVFKPYLTTLNAIPRLILAPLFFIIFGLGEGSKIALGAAVVFFIAFFNAFQGVREVDRNVYNNALLLGANRRQMTWHVLLPSAVSWILTSLNTAVGFSMAAVIVAEYLGSSRGMGHLISISQGRLDATGVMTGLVILSSAVVVVQLGVSWAERRLVKWKPNVSDGSSGT